MSCKRCGLFYLFCNWNGSCSLDRSEHPGKEVLGSRLVHVKGNLVSHLLRFHWIASLAYRQEFVKEDETLRHLHEIRSRETFVELDQGIKKLSRTRPASWFLWQCPELACTDRGPCNSRSSGSPRPQVTGPPCWFHSPGPDFI